MLPESHPLFMAEQMLAFLFQEAPADHWIEFRAIWNPESEKPQPPAGMGALPEGCLFKDFERSFDLAISDWIMKKSALGYDIFYGVCPRFQMTRGARGGVKSAHDVDVSHAVCAWIDMDNVAWREIAKQEGIKATIVVSSGRGAHFYFRYPKLVEIALAIEDTKKLITLYGGDKATGNASRLLRVPGTRNWKKEAEGRSCEIAEMDLDRVFRGEEDIPAERPKGSGNVMGLQMDLRNLILHGPKAATGGYELIEKNGKKSRSEYDMVVAKELVKEGWTDDDIFAVFKNPDYAISEKTLEEAQKGNAENYILKQTLPKAHEKAEKENLRYSQVGEILIIETEEDIDKAPPPTFAVDALLPSYGTLILSGPAKAGKSLLTTDLMLLLAGAQGRFIERFQVNKPGTVLYCQDEIPKSFLKQRMSTVGKSRGIDWRKLPHKLRFYNASFNLGEPRHVNALIAALKSVEADYLIIDPLSDYHTMNENKQSDMIAIFSSIERTSREAGLRGTVVIHHHGKPMEGEQKDGIFMPRGSSVIGAKGDGHVIVRAATSKVTQKDYVEVHFRLRAAKAPAPIKLLLDEDSLRFYDYSEDQDNVQITLQVVDEEKGQKEKVLNRLQAMGYKKTDAERNYAKAIQHKDGKDGKDGNGAPHVEAGESN